jgi:hypothetical protein
MSQPVDIFEAADGVEAVEQFALLSGEKTISLLDINMPRTDFRRVRECGIWRRPIRRGYGRRLSL